MTDKNSLMNVEQSRNFRAKTLAHHRSYSAETRVVRARGAL